MVALCACQRPIVLKNDASVVPVPVCLTLSVHNRMQIAVFSVVVPFAILHRRDIASFDVCVEWYSSLFAPYDIVAKWILN
jgi:hypothetical protein